MCSVSSVCASLRYPFIVLALFGGKTSRGEKAADKTKSLQSGKYRKRDQNRSGSRKNLSKWPRLNSRNSSEIYNTPTKEGFLCSTHSHDDLILENSEGTIITHL